MISNLGKDSSMISSNPMIQNDSTTIPNLNNNTNNNKLPEDSQLLSSSIETNPFLFIQPALNSNPFKIIPHTQTNDLSILKHKYKLLMCITSPSDSILNTTQLKITIDSLYQNFATLKEIGLSPNSIFICLFIKQIENVNSIAQFYVGNDINNPGAIEHFGMIYRLMNCNEFICNYITFPKTLNFRSDINGMLLIKNENINDVEIFDLFYEQICSNVIEANEDDANVNYPLFACFIKGGVHFPGDCLLKLITSTYENNNNNNRRLKKVCVFPSTDIIANSNGNMNIYHKIKKYETLHYNIYDLCFYTMSTAPCINTACSLFKITPQLLDEMKSYYENEITSLASIDYHNNKLSLYLTQLGYEVNYIPSIEIKQTKDKSYNFSDIMSEYTNIYQSNFALNFDIFHTEILRCSDSSYIKKMIMVFHLLGSFFEFTFPSFSLMIIYTIYFEGFALKDTNPNAAIFFSTLYIMLNIIFTLTSLITTQNFFKNKKTLLYLSIIYNIYIYFTLIIAIPAVHHIRINKNITTYTFNTGAMVVLIILNVLLGVVPMLLNIKKVFSTVLEMLLYLILGCPCYNGMFMVHGITNCVNAIGMSEDKRYHFKSLINTWYVILNTVIGLLILTMTTRKSRVSCVLALSIIFTIYNCIKIGSIIWGRMFIINKHEEISVSDVAQSEIKKWIVKNSDVIENAQCLDVNMNDGNNNNNKGKDEEAVVFSNLDDAIKFKKNNEDDLDVESHNKAFISHQYDDNDSIRGKNSIIEQHQQITQMQKGSNRSGSGVGKKKSKKSEKKINSKRSGNENEEKNGKDNININVNVNASNMSKHIGNSLDSNVINDINNNLIVNSSNNDNGNGKEETVVQKEENKEDNGISESNVHNYNVDDGINKVDVVNDGNKSENNEIQQSFHNDNGNENIVVIEHDKDKEEEQQQQQSVKEDDNDIKVSQVHSIKDNMNNENEENNKSKELEPSQINNDNNNNNDVDTFQQKQEEEQQQQNQQEEEQAQQVHIQPENTEQPTVTQEKTHNENNNTDNNNNIQLQTLDNIISNDNPPIKEEPIDTNEIKIE